MHSWSVKERKRKEFQKEYFIKEFWRLSIKINYRIIGKKIIDNLKKDPNDMQRILSVMGIDLQSLEMLQMFWTNEYC